MKKMRKIISLLLASLMVFSMVGCGSKKADTTVTNAPTNAATEENTTEEQTEAKTDAPTKAPENLPTELTINLHYLREDGAYTGWNVWLWADGGEGNAYQFGTETDDKGVVTSATLPAGTSKIGYIVRLNEWEKKDVDADQFIELSGIIAGSVDVYVTSGKPGCEIVPGEDCLKGLSVKKAELNGDFKSITIVFTEEYKDEHTILVKDAEGKELATEEFKVNDKDATKATVNLKEEVDKFGKYVISLDGIEFDVTVPSYFSTQAFEDEYTYEGDDLGATWTKDSTTFKVWAPTAKKVTVNTYKSGLKGTDDLIKSYEMKAEDKGVWSVKVDEDLNGVYYLYEVDFGTSKVEACDPYAKAVGVNGDRAMVIDLESTNPEEWDKDTNPNKDLNATDASVWEVHIRDFSSDSSSGMKNVGKYLAFTEKGTKNPTGQSTGIDHIVDLGVTHVQIGPAYDYATVNETKLDTPQFNWGYDPKNYNAPEGSYSTDPYDGAVRVGEFKQMVKSLHDNGLSVVMDVVYNHTYNTTYCYNQIVPDFFYRPGSNGSGCGNDVASERAMVSKFIVDSVVYWAKEYHIDGFRFDLVGLIDIDTIKACREELDKIDPSIILYGEGWSMSTKTTKNVELATQFYVNKIDGFAMFSDTIRDAIKGSVFNATEKGYVNGDLGRLSTIKKAVTGNTDWAGKGSQAIVYASCHDNYTLWDEINMSNPDDSLEDKIKQNLLSAAIVYTAQGTPFILAGEEFLRTKPGAKEGTFDYNSYASSDAVNSIKWATLNDANYQKVFEYYKGMIAFRKAHASLRVMDEADKYYKFTDGTDKGVLAYELSGVEGEVSDSIFVVYNPLKTATTVTLPDGEWTICVQGDKAGTESLGTATGSITVDAITATILVKGATK